MSQFAGRCARVPKGSILLAAVALAPMNVAGTAVALPGVAADLGSNTIALQWAVNGFNVTFAVCMIVAGVLADRFGSRRMFALGLVIVLTSAAVSALAPNLGILDAGRALAGGGCAAVMAGGLALISNTYAGAERSRMFALFGVVVGVGLAFGPTIMGAITEWISWRGVYSLFGVVSLSALALTRLLPLGRRTLGQGHLAVDISVLRRPTFVAFALVPLVPAVGFVPIYTYLPVALSAVFDMSAAQAGVFMLPMALPVLVGPVVAARLLRRVRWVTPTTVIYVSCAVLIAGDLGMLMLSPDLPAAAIVLPLILVSLGYGLQIGLVDAEAMAAVPEHSSGTAAGIVNFCRMGSAAIVVTAYGLLLATHISQTLPPETAAKVTAGQAGHAAVYAHAFGFLALMAACVVAVLTVMVVWLQYRAIRSI